MTGQVGWTLTGNVSYAVCQWGMLIVLAKTLSVAVVGQFALGLAISNPIFMLTNLQLRAIQATRASDAFAFRDFLGLRMLSNCLALLLITAIAITVGSSRETTFVIVAVGFSKALEASADVVYGHLQHAEAMNRIAISMTSKGILSFALLTAIVLAMHDVLWAVGAVALGSLAILLCYDLPGVKLTGVTSLVPRWSRDTLSGIVRLGLPLGIASLFLAVAVNTPRFYLERVHGEAELGYFSALAYPAAAFTILLSAFGQAATPRMAASYRGDRRGFWKLVAGMSFVPIVVTGFIATGALVIGPRILELIYRREYAHYFNAFLVLLASGATWSMASVMGYAATASRRLRAQAPAAFSIAAVSVLLSAWLVPSRGLMGAGAASLLSGLAAFLVYGGLFLGSADASLDGAPLRASQPIREQWRRAEAESEAAT